MIACPRIDHKDTKVFAAQTKPLCRGVVYSHRTANRCTLCFIVALHKTPVDPICMLDSEPIEFFTFDKDAELTVSARHLPHWFQTGVAIFVTFRTFDSIPKSALMQMKSEFEQWLNLQSLPASIVQAQFHMSPERRKSELSQFSKDVQSRILRKFNALFHQTLDGCHGECVFKNPSNRQIVFDAMLFHDGLKYDLDCFVVMPNHVHAIVQFRDGFNLRLIGQSWMRYTARLINKNLGSQGNFWQTETFDHIIRSVDQLVYLRKYTESNASVAKLSSDQFTFWKR